MAHSGKTITFATDLVPQEDNIYRLGYSNQRWKIYGDLQPLATKIYTAKVYGADGSGTCFYQNFMTVMPVDYNAIWTVTYRVTVTADGHSDYTATYDEKISGRSNTYYSWYSYNSLVSYPIYQHMLLNSSSTNAPHEIGIRMASSYGDTTVVKKIQVDLLETYNCTAVLLDNLKYYTSATPSGFVWRTWNATSNGMQESGDNNDTGYYILSNGFKGKAGSNKVYRYCLFARTGDGTYESFVMQDNTVATTKTVNPHGFVPDGKIYWNSNNTVYNEGTLNLSAYEQYHVIDYRYSFNFDNQFLPDYCETYVVYTYNENDGLLYLDTTQWLAAALPTTADGKIYQRIGSKYYTGTSNYYQGSLLLDNPYYEFKNGKIRTWAPSTRSIKSITRSGTTFTATRDDGSTFTFTQQDTNKYHKSGSWSGLTYTATAVNSADELKFTIPNKIQTNWELNATSGNSPALLFTRDASLTDWKIFVTAGKLSFQSATDGSTWTERAYFKDNTGDFVATSFTGNGSNLTSLNASNLSSGTVPVARLPLATTSAAGAVKVGSGISVSDGTISVTAGNLGLSGALRYQGTTTTAMSDGLTTATVKINNADFTPSAGDVVIYNDAEYLWTGSLWELIGAESSFKKVQTAVSSSSASGNSATTFVSSVTQDTQGVITVKTSTLNTSGTWSGTATKASYPEGFSSRSTNATWGNQTGATVTCWNESDGGSIDIRKNNPSSGKVSIKVDGRFYGNEGNNPAMLMSDPNNTSYWGMGNPDGSVNVWIRTTSLGIIPFQSGGASAGHGGIGTSSWYFASSYIQNMYGNHTGNVTTSSITHIDGGSVNNGSWTTGATGTAPTATTTDGTTTYSGATIGTSILTLGNNKVGGNSASGVANNSQGILRLYSSGSAYGELTGYTTGARTHIHASTGISLPENIIDIMFRPGSSSYYTHIAYETSGNEALVAATQNTVTSFIFVNGESYANVASDRWTKLTGASGAGHAPGLQIKQNCVSIGELIPSGTNATYKLNVNGTSNFKGDMTSTGSFYTSGHHISLISGGETDQFIDFAYAANPTASTAPGASWRIGALNSGSGDGNYFVIQTGGSATNATTWHSALRFGMNTYDAAFGGNVYPLSNNNKTLGTSSLKWNNVYATTFTGNLTGNADTATSAGKWTTARTLTIGNKGQSVDGSDNVTWSLADIGALASTTKYAASSSVGGAATNATTTANTSDSIYPVGVKSGATTTLLHDTSITMKGNAITAVTYNSTAASLTSETSTTANTAKYATLTLGNNANVNSTTAHSEGQIIMYSAATQAHTIKGASTTTAYTHTLPNNTGLLVSLSGGTAKGSTTKPVYIPNTGIVTECSTYAGGTKVTFNGADKGASTASFYAPTSGGTAGNVLISAGTSAPAWYGGAAMTGTAAASWKTAFNGTTDATASNAAAVTIAGGLGIAKSIIVGTTATITNDTRSPKFTLTVNDADKAYLQYNTTDDSIDFIFV